MTDSEQLRERQMIGLRRKVKELQDERDTTLGRRMACRTVLRRAEPPA
jgi:hypothetical protein